jgi:hypothetical protein
MENVELKKWYKENYPQDGYDSIIEENTFQDLFECIDKNIPLDRIGISDTVVRERLFAKLAEIIKMPYTYISDRYTSIN